MLYCAFVISLNIVVKLIGISRTKQNKASLVICECVYVCILSAWHISSSIQKSEISKQHLDEMAFL